MEKLNELMQLLNSKYDRMAILTQKLLEGDIDTGISIKVF